MLEKECQGMLRETYKTTLESVYLHDCQILSSNSQSTFVAW
jgi:hypothetical protein